MYPLNVSNGIGYAVANDEDEHERLTEMGYAPAFAPGPDDALQAARAAAAAAGVVVDNRWSIRRLNEEIAKVTPQ